MGISPSTARRNAVLDGLTDDDPATLLPDPTEQALELADVLHEPVEPVEVVYFTTVSVVYVVAGLYEDPVVETATVGREGIVALSVLFGAGAPTERSLVAGGRPRAGPERRGQPHPTPPAATVR